MKMCAAIAEEEHKVTLFAKGKASETLYDDYDVPENFTLALAPLVKVPLLSGLFRLLHIGNKAFKLGKPDFVYGRDLIMLFLFTPKDRPFAIELHQIPGNPVERFALTWLVKCGNFRGLVCISEGLKSDVLSLLPGLKPEKILVAHDGADAPLRKPNFKNPETPLKIGYAGSNHKGKGVELIAEIAKLCPEDEFHIWGKTDRTSSGNLIFHGPAPHKDIPKALRDCHILLAPYQESATIASGVDIARWISPLKLFEYMAANRPILCSDLPVLREILTHNETALMLPPDQPEIWANAIELLSKDQDKAKMIANNGYDMLKSQFTWAKRTQSILSFIAPSTS